MFNFLIFGFLAGITHVFEADHIALVKAITKKSNPKKHSLFLGISWGVGHAIMLLLIGSFVIYFGWVLSAAFNLLFELVVGMLLLALGVNIFIVNNKKKVMKPKLTDSVMVDNQNWRQYIKVLFVGLLHGAAGSGILIALVIGVKNEPITAMTYIGLFGLGSVVGMGIVSYLLAWPIKWLNANGYYSFFRIAMGCLLIGVGANIWIKSLPNILEYIE